MKINITHMQDNKSFVLEEDVQPASLDLDIGVMHFKQPLQLKIEAWKSEDDLTINAHVEGERTFQCSLCLEDFNNLFEKDFTLHYDIKGQDSVVIDPEVRDEILLDHPIRVLCKDSCRGLCPDCGANLNNGPCRCSK